MDNATGRNKVKAHGATRLERDIPGGKLLRGRYVPLLVEGRDGKTQFWRGNGCRHFNKKHIPFRKISLGESNAFNELGAKLDNRDNETFHPRVFVIGDMKLYLSGSSLKGLDGQCFVLMRVDATEVFRSKKTALE